NFDIIRPDHRVYNACALDTSCIDMVHSYSEDFLCMEDDGRRIMYTKTLG
ncbi:MAG: hypothetical protein UU35_C0013G0024, partial [Candidatus Uhrbacteria bacterium GW2011_GWC2_41_11]